MAKVELHSNALWRYRRSFLAGFTKSREKHSRRNTVGETMKKDDSKVPYSEEEKKDPISGLAKELKKLKKKFKKLRRSVRASK